MLLLWMLLLGISLFVLLKSADYFTDSAEKIGIHLGIPAFIVGITIVSVGTSLPELVTSLISIYKNSSEIVIGNVIGSNVTNIFLVLGVSAIIGKKLKITHEIAKIDLPLFVGSAFLMGVCIFDGVFTFAEAIFCVLGLIIYLVYTIKSEKKNKDPIIKKELKTELRRKKLHSKTIIILILSAFFVYLGSKFTIDSVIEISKLLGVGSEIIAATAVALGTSLPELTVSANAAKKGKSEMAIGNILGSNIFNSLAVLGISGLFGNLIIPANMLNFGFPMMLIATFFFLFMTQTKEVSKWEGWFLFMFYFLFIGKLFGFF
jgi:cation:H+ antiporter